MEKILKEIADAIRNALLSQNVVTGIRTVGTVYQNTTGRPLLVAASVLSNTANTFATAKTDASNPPTTSVAFIQLTQVSTAQEIIMVVLPGSYYKVEVAAGVPTVGLWTEWRI